MQSAKKVFDQAQASGKTKKPYLRLGEQLEGGGVKSTGAHTIMLVSDSIGKGKDPMSGAEVEQLQVIVTEGGVEKMWNIPLKDKESNLHYLVQRLAEFNEGDTLVVEMKKKGMRNFIDVKSLSQAKAAGERTVEQGEEIPVINLDDEEIKAEDIPF